MSEHCVQVLFSYSGTDLYPVSELEEQLQERIEAAGVGEFDGNDVGEGRVTLYMYGPDADALYAAIAPALSGSELLKDGGIVVKRYGPPEDGVREERIELPA